MAGSYELWLTDDEGVRLADADGHTFLDGFLELRASRIVNGIGHFSLLLPPTFNNNLLRPDNMVQVWRAPEGGRRTLWRVYFIRKWRFLTTDAEYIVVEGPDCNDLLRRRIAAHFAASPQAEKIDYADDMMKELVTEAIADGTNPPPTAGTRVWANLSVAVDLGDGPTLTKGMAWRYLLKGSGSGVLPDIAQAAKEAGAEVFFDIVPDVVTSSSITFQFRTYTGQPGMDVSDRVVFDQRAGNMTNPQLEYDYSNEVNYVYAGGRGEDSSRIIEQAYDEARYGVSIWNRCEGFADARNEDQTYAVREVGRALLWDGRPRRRFSAVPVDTKGTRFGRDWDFGYKVCAQYRNVKFDSIVRAVSLQVRKQEEKISARLDYED